MDFTAEQLKKISEAKSAEELIALAKAEGIEISEEEIKAKFDAMHKEGEIADDELDNAAGGGCFDSPVDEAMGKYVRVISTGRFGIMEDYCITQNQLWYKVKLDDDTIVKVLTSNVEFVNSNGTTGAAISF